MPTRAICSRCAAGTRSATWSSPIACSRKCPELTIGFTGARDEARAIDALVRKVDDARCISLAGQTTLRQLLVLYGLAEVLVTNDSGPAHFASLTTIHTVTLFGPETPCAFRRADRAQPVDLHRARLQPVRERFEQPAILLHEQRLHAAHHGGAGLRSRARGSARRQARRSRRPRGRSSRSSRRKPRGLDGFSHR